MSRSAFHVLLALPTLMRPAGLARLLDAVGALEVPRDTRLEVLVLDNANEPGAFGAVAARKPGFAVPLAYRHVPGRGLSRVRNAALDAGIEAGATHLAFLDDDEVPPPGWLAAHLCALGASGAAASMGPVRPDFEHPPPRWIREGAFHSFDAPRDLAPLAEGATSNTVLSMRPVIRHGLRFDRRLDRVGGEDTAFFAAYCATGATLVFAARAGVTETIPPVRMRLGWLLRRWRRTGQTNAALARPGRLRGAGSGLMRMALGLGVFALGVPLMAFGRPAAWARGLRIAARGLGYVDWALGHQTMEYARIER